VLGDRTWSAVPFSKSRSVLHSHSGSEGTTIGDTLPFENNFIRFVISYRLSYLVERSKQKGYCYRAFVTITRVYFSNRKYCIELQSKKFLSAIMNWKFQKLMLSRKVDSFQTTPSYGLHPITDLSPWFDPHSMSSPSPAFIFELSFNLKMTISSP
jgi:hypothetical protein